MKKNTTPKVICETSKWDQIDPEFSLVTATYQRRTEISKLLASVCKQLRMDTKRFEHIICDNASDDGTSDVIQQHMLQQDNVAMRYYKQSENLGLDKNIQDTLRLARGNYVWFIADDDDVAPGKLSEVADACGESQLPLIIVRANCVADWDSIPRQGIGDGLVEIDPKDPRWKSMIFATSFLASMVFRRDQIKEFQPNVAKVFGTNYTPWALGLSIISNAECIGLIDDLCTLGNVNFQGSNRFPPYRTLIKGRVQVWDSCAEGVVKRNLRSILVGLSASGWRSAAVGKLEIGNGKKDLLTEYFQSFRYFGIQPVLSLPWVLIALLLPIKFRLYLNRFRMRSGNGSATENLR